MYLPATLFYDVFHNIHIKNNLPCPLFKIVTIWPILSSFHLYLHAVHQIYSIYITEVHVNFILYFLLDCSQIVKINLKFIFFIKLYRPINKYVFEDSALFTDMFPSLKIWGEGSNVARLNQSLRAGKFMRYLQEGEIIILLMFLYIFCLIWIKSHMKIFHFMHHIQCHIRMIEH